MKNRRCWRKLVGRCFCISFFIADTYEVDFAWCREQMLRLAEKNSQNKLLLVPCRDIFVTRSWNKIRMFWKIPPQGMDPRTGPVTLTWRQGTPVLSRQLTPRRIAQGTNSPLFVVWILFYPLRCGGGVFSNEEIKAKNASYHKKWGLKD